MLPAYCKIRVPELIYTTQFDGFSYQTMMAKVKPFWKQQNKFSILIIKTRKGAIFGCFTDCLFRKLPMTYQGTDQCSVFTLRPNVESYYDTQANNRYLLCDLEYIQLGGDGEGPALWLDESLTRG